MIEPNQARKALGELLMEVVGKYPVDLNDARRHAVVLARAMSMLEPDQQAEARARIAKLETRWGALLPREDDNAEIPSDLEPVQIIARWLAKQKEIDRLVPVLKRAAKAVGEGVTSLSEIMDYAYELETDRVLRPVSYKTFQRWMVQLRIARQNRNGAGTEWRPGPWHMLWVAGETVDAAVHLTRKQVGAG